jgi:hypothetical protein
MPAELRFTLLRTPWVEGRLVLHARDFASVERPALDWLRRYIRRQERPE